MRRVLLLSTLVAAGFLTACEDGADILIIDEPPSTLLVENTSDEGEGSLRAALETANADPAVNSIQVAAGLGTVNLASSLEYTGSQTLRIVGNGLVLDGGDCGCDVLASTGGADLDLFDLTLKDGVTGLRVEVPTSRTGIATLRLLRVTAEGNDGYGVHVLEQGEGSVAGLQVELVSSTVRQNGAGQGAAESDGIRVEEAGDGDLTFVARDLTVTGNAGDGVELDEAGTGDLVVDVQDSAFDDNGDMPQSPSSPEDGFDAGESGVGHLDVRFLGSSAEDNHQQGIELAEAGPGDLRAVLTEVEASNNQGDNLQLREDTDADGGSVPGAGGIIATLANVTAQEADDDGGQIQELGAGDLNVQIQDGDFSDNGDDGLNVTQGGTGRGRLHLVRVATDGNGGFPVTSTGTTVTEGNDQTTLVRVRNAEDDGFGSLRAALELADEDKGVTTILFEADIGTIEIASSLEFGGSQDLVLSGGGAVVDAADCDCDAFVVTGSGNLVVERLSFRDAPGNGLLISGGGDLTLRNLALEGMEKNGVLMDVPDTATGLVTVRLDQATIKNNSLHGLFIDDLVDTGGTGGSSAAGIFLDITASRVEGNGFRQDVVDRDGIRVDEGGSGGIEVRMIGSIVEGNAGDGMELIEAGLGGVVADLRLSSLSGNGSQPQNPDEKEDGVDIAESGPGSVRLDLKGIDTQTSSLRNNGDLGIEITEDGSGDVITNLDLVLATGNGAGTMGLVEDTDAENNPTGGSGGIFATFNQVTAGQTDLDGILMKEYGQGDLNLVGRGLDSSDNGGDGAWLEERGIGGVVIDLANSFFDDNGKVPLDPDDLGDGLELRESGSGTVDVRVLSTSFSRNADQGLDVEEQGSGDLRATLTVVSAVSNKKDNVKLVEDLDAKDGAGAGSGNLYLAFAELTSTGSLMDGVQLAEYGEGNLTGQIAASSIRINTGNGVDATQAGAGTGQLQLVGVTLAANGGGNILAAGVTVTEVEG